MSDIIGPVVIEGENTGDQRTVSQGAVSLAPGMVPVTVYAVDPYDHTKTAPEHLRVGVVTAMKRRGDEIVITGRLSNPTLAQELLGVSSGRIPASADLASCEMEPPEMVEVDGQWVEKEPDELHRVASCVLVGVTLNVPGDAEPKTWVDWS